MANDIKNRLLLLINQHDELVVKGTSDETINQLLYQLYVEYCYQNDLLVDDRKLNKKNIKNRLVALKKLVANS